MKGSSIRQLFNWFGFLVFLLFIIAQSATAETPNAFFQSGDTAPEYRFLWVTRYELQTTKDIELIIERAKKYNFNALFIQVCALGEAYYRSEVMPLAKCVTQNFDPLQEVLYRAHAEGIEVHAWLNTNFVWEQNRKLPEDTRHIVRAHPEWLTRDKQGRSIMEYKGLDAVLAHYTGVYLDPAIPAVREYLSSLFVEVVQKYPVDGVHFDYIRYPGAEFGYVAEALDVFQKEYQADPRALVNNKSVALGIYGENRYKELVETWKVQRESYLTQLVRLVAEKTRGLRKNIKISAAVIPDLARAKRDYFQDWESWLKLGVLDFVVPMSYSTKLSVVEQQIGSAAQIAQKYKAGVVAGLGAWRQSPEEITEKIFFVRKLHGVMGFTSIWGTSLFSYDTISAKPGYLATVRDKVFTSKVATPVSQERAALPVSGNIAQESEE